jgi:hypothetical protein
VCLGGFIGFDPNSPSQTLDAIAAPSTSASFSHQSVLTYGLRTLSHFLVASSVIEQFYNTTSYHTIV